MAKDNWFISYFHMTEYEREIYKEFEMEDKNKELINIYIRMYEAVSLMASEFEKQIVSLPKEINIADEIALLFGDEVVHVMDLLYKNGMLSIEECTLIRDIDKILSTMETLHEKNLWTLEALKQSELWMECREKAKHLLLQLYKIV